MSVEDYDRAVNLRIPGDNEGDTGYSYGDQPSFLDITEKQRPYGDRPIITPTSSLAQAKDMDKNYVKHAILLRRKLDKNGNSTSTQLEIQSRVIQDALKTTMEECSYLNLAASPIIIMSPYYELFQYRKEIRDHAKNPERTEAEKASLNILIQFMETNLAKTEKIHAQYLPHWMSTYEILWTYFRPETFIIYQCEHFQELYRVTNIEYKLNEVGRDDYFEILVWSWDFNGNAFGPATSKLRILQFQGARRLTELDAFPLECLPEDERRTVVDRLIERGKKWRGVVARGHQQYSGPGWVAVDPVAERRGRVESDKSSLVPIHVMGRVMVDYLSHRQRNYMLGTELYTHGEPITLTKANGATLNPPVPALASEGREPEKDRLMLNKMISYNNTDLYEITDFQAAMAPARVRGFSLSEKRWSFFLVEKLEDIEWMESRFQELEVQEQWKDMIEALVAQYHEHIPQMNQLAKKDRGQVILLYGATGTGKTLTAESIAELTHRPLYYIGTSELISPLHGDPDTNMRAVFDLATSWGAIILLDEADVFLARRGALDNYRNGLVATFLRVLEYHEGVVFLTTNRLEDFDDAFESRLNLRLRYHPLTTEKRAAIWKTVLERVPAARGWTDGDYERAARELDVNGRQISNLVRTAVAMSNFKGVPLTVDSLKVVHEMNFGATHEDRD